MCAHITRLSVSMGQVRNACTCTSANIKQPAATTHITICIVSVQEGGGGGGGGGEGGEAKQWGEGRAISALDTATESLFRLTTVCRECGSGVFLVQQSYTHGG